MGESPSLDDGSLFFSMLRPISVAIDQLMESVDGIGACTGDLQGLEVDGKRFEMRAEDALVQERHKLIAVTHQMPSLNRLLPKVLTMSRYSVNLNKP